MTTLCLSIIRKGRASEVKKIEYSGDVHQVMKFLEKEEREKFYVLHLSAKNQLLAMELVAVGSLTRAVIHPREVFKAAVLHNSASIIVVHNHPSGDALPSRDDIAITNRLKAAGKIIGIELLDHVVIGDDVCFSFNEHLEEATKKGKIR